tara:strand:+ start:212 stop:538 length:327 start_codon:yes stop_codon:yes gene_type:complete
MTPLEKLQDKLNIQIDDMYMYRLHDLEVSTMNTADGYEIYCMRNSRFENGIDWENDIYYYQPSFEDIMERILDLDAGSRVYVDDLEAYMPDYEIEEWLNDNEDLDEDN